MNEKKGNCVNLSREALAIEIKAFRESTNRLAENMLAFIETAQKQYPSAII